MTGLINSFQVYNIYIDRAMELLTANEFRVLMFATRHITGWQDKINEHQGNISISMFQKGFVTKNGTRFAGCGLSRQTIIDVIASLVGYGFLERDGKATTKGQKYTLHTDGIQWDLLEQRHQEWQNSAKKRTVAATAKSIEKRAGGTSDVTGTLDVTMRGTSDVTMLGTLDVTESKTYSKPTSKTKTAAPHSRKKLTPLQQLQARLQPHTVLAAALLELFDPGYRQAIHTPAEYLITIVQLEKYVPILEDLAALKATAEEVKAVYTYLKPGYDKQQWVIGLKTIVEKIPAYRVWRENGGETQIKIATGVWQESAPPELPIVSLSAEERANLIAESKARKAIPA